MAESIHHQKFVNSISEFITDNIPEICVSLILLDSPISKNKPFPNSDGFVPDVYYKFDKLMIIGEAKTRGDINNKHTIMQVESYLSDLEIFEGDRYFIFAVPWDCSAQISNLLIRLSKDKSCLIKIIIINEFGCYYVR